MSPPITVRLGQEYSHISCLFKQQEGELVSITTFTVPEGRLVSHPFIWRGEKYSLAVGNNVVGSESWFALSKDREPVWSQDFVPGESGDLFNGLLEFF